MLKNLLFKKIIQSQLKNLPEKEQGMILTIVEKDPEFFMQIAKEVQDKMKEGKDQMGAVQEVLTNHKVKLTELLKESDFDIPKNFQ